MKLFAVRDTGRFCKLCGGKHYYVSNGHRVIADKKNELKASPVRKLGKIVRYNKNLNDISGRKIISTGELSKEVDKCC